MTMLGTLGSRPGTFQQAAIAPINVQAGDQVIVAGGIVSFVRNGVVVATRPLGAVSEVSLGAMQDETIDRVIFYRSNPMPGVSVTLESVVPEEAGTKLYFNFSNGNQREFNSLADALEAVAQHDTDAGTAEDLLILGTCRRMVQNANNINALRGQKCSINGSAMRPVSID